MLQGKPGFNEILTFLGMVIQNTFTAAKLVAVFIIICGGAYKLIVSGTNKHLQSAFNDPTPNFPALATAFYTGLWAYDGWNNLNYVTEEIKNPGKSITVFVPLRI